MDVSVVTPDDIPAVKELLSRTWKATYAGLYPAAAIEKITAVWHAPDQLLMQAQDRNTYFAAAKMAGKTVGIITVRQNPDRSLFLSRLYVDPSCQRQGVGSRLLEAALARFHGAPLISLECEKQNEKACAFYLKKGFVPGTEKVEDVEGVSMTTVEYSQALSPD